MDQITSVSDFEYFRDKSVIIRTWKFNNTITVRIQVGDDWIPVMSGNFWDFYPGCHGGWFYRITPFKSPLGLIVSLKEVLESVNAKVEISDPV